MMRITFFFSLSLFLVIYIYRLKILLDWNPYRICTVAHPLRGGRAHLSDAYAATATHKKMKRSYLYLI